MNELFDISILAESENGIAEVIFVVVVALAGIIVSAVANLKKKRQEQEEQLRLAELRNEARAENKADDDEWSVVEEPFAVAPPVRAERSVPVQLQSTVMRRSDMPSSRPPKIVHNLAPARSKSSRLATPRDHSDVHRTVPSKGVSDPIYSQPSATAIHLDAAAARQAIIFHEIFSPPKALREQYELWD